jgi:putative transposase
LVSPKVKRKAHAHLIEKYQVSVRRACLALGLHQSTFYYRALKCRNEATLRDAITALTQRKKRFGRPRVVWHLRTIQGLKDNHKRIARVYREMGMQIGKRVRGKGKCTRPRLVLEKPTRPLELWAMDFVSDSFHTGRKFRSLTLTDLFTHESPAIEVDVSLTGERVAKVLDRLKLVIGLPRAIICDNGPEFISKAMDLWAYTNKVELKFIQPGKPNQNAYCESFNARLRDECLNMHVFENLTDARNIIEAWRKEYNEENPHSSLGMKAPKTFALEFKERLSA